MLRHVTNAAHIDCVDVCGHTPLMLAVTNGHSDVASVLVEHGARVDCTDKHLRTALHRAVSCSHTELAHRIIIIHPLGALIIGN